MSVKLQFERGSLVTKVVVKDEALIKLLEIAAKYCEIPVENEPAVAQVIGANNQPFIHAPISDRTQAAKAWLGRHASSEVLSSIGWSTLPEKLLLLGAHLEATSEIDAWRNADINSKFVEARETPPGNFARDVSIAIKEGTVASVSARSYRVGRLGWNKIAEAIAALPQ